MGDYVTETLISFRDSLMAEARRWQDEAERLTKRADYAVDKAREALGRARYINDAVVKRESANDNDGS